MEKNIVDECKDDASNKNSRVVIGSLELLGLALVPAILVGGAIYCAAENIKSYLGKAPYDLDNEWHA